MASTYSSPTSSSRARGSGQRRTDGGGIDVEANGQRGSHVEVDGGAGRQARWAAASALLSRGDGQ
eukprot:scaffold9530_cov104-Isochrysis_galbana.AAC.4